ADGERPHQRGEKERDREGEHDQVEPRQPRGVVAAPDRREREQPHERQTGQMRRENRRGRETGPSREWFQRDATGPGHARASRSAAATVSASSSVSEG